MKYILSSTPIVRVVLNLMDALSTLGFNDFGFVYLQMNREKLMKMANTVRTGGKGTVRRYSFFCFSICMIQSF